MASATIKNGRDTPINQQTGTTPNMIDTLRNWYQPITFVQLVKNVENFQLEEFSNTINFHGVIQPLKPRELMMKPEGQRTWSWFELHADPVLTLQVDDIVKYNGVKTRVMARTDYTLYGYVYYQIVQDWVGC